MTFICYKRKKFTQSDNDLTMCYYLFSVISMVIGKPVSTWKLETTVEKVEKFLDIHMSDFFDWYISEIIMVYCTKQCLLFRNYLQTLFIAFYRLLKIKDKKNCPYNIFLILPMNKKIFWKSEKRFCYLSPRLSNKSFIQHLPMMVAEA